MCVRELSLNFNRRHGERVCCLFCRSTILRKVCAFFVVVFRRASGEGAATKIKQTRHGPFPQKNEATEFFKLEKFVCPQSMPSPWHFFLHSCWAVFHFASGSSLYICYWERQDILSHPHFFFRCIINYWITATKCVVKVTTKKVEFPLFLYALWRLLMPFALSSVTNENYFLQKVIMRVSEKCCLQQSSSAEKREKDVNTAFAHTLDLQRACIYHGPLF